jgi:hypothetical protein
MREGMNTPWGKAQSAEQLAPGIFAVSTAGHGGIKLDRKLNSKVPEYMRRKGGWYEEDCEWAIPYVIFSELLLANGDKHAIGLIGRNTHISTLRNWYPAAYERFFNVVLVEGESSVRDSELFAERNANNWLVTAAWGDWQPGVPKGLVGVVATEGGKRGSYLEKVAERYFLVPNDEYQNRSSNGFVINLDQHKEIEEFF